MVTLRPVDAWAAPQRSRATTLLESYDAPVELRRSSRASEVRWAVELSMVLKHIQQLVNEIKAIYNFNFTVSHFSKAVFHVESFRECSW